MVMIFNTAVIDDDYNIIEDRSVIAKTYLKGWFWIDLISIIPFDLFKFTGENGEAASLIRFLRIGRIIKILRLIKLMRIMKLH